MHKARFANVLGHIRAPGSRRRRWSVVACLLLLCGASWAAGQAPTARVTVAAVRQRELSRGQTFVGTVMPVRSSTVGSTVEGRVVELAVREGDEVRQGDTLARLRTRQLEIQLAAAKAELAVRREELAELQSSLPQQIRQAESRVLAAKALMKYAEARLGRYQGLFRRNAISESELEEVESAAVAAEEKYNEEQVGWRLAIKVSPLKIEQARARVEAQQEQVHRLEDDIAEHTIAAPFDGFVTMEHTEVGEWIAKGDPVAELVELGSVYVEVPVLESYISQLRPPELVGPLSPEVGSELKPGAVSDPLRREFQRHGIRLSGQAEIAARREGAGWRISDQGQEYAVSGRGELRVTIPGTAARVEVGALPAEEFHGEVVAVVPQADVRSRSFPVKVLLPNRPGPGGVLLKPGMFARVILPVSDTPEAILVPKDAVVLGGQSPLVYVVDPIRQGPAAGPGPSQAGPSGDRPSGDKPSPSGPPAGPKPDGTARPVPVELGPAVGGWVEVGGALRPGQQVVVEGNERLFPGCPVSIARRSAASPAPAKPQSPE